MWRPALRLAPKHNSVFYLMTAQKQNITFRNKKLDDFLRLTDTQYYN